MKHRLFGATALIAVVLISAIGSPPVYGQSACATPFFKIPRSEWKDFCDAQGVALHEIRVFDPAYSCDSNESEWAEAKENIDWVWFKDAAALGDYKAALAEFDSTGCIAANMEWDRPLFAVLYAQRHNAHAQCSIWNCRRDFGGVEGYFNTTKEAGKLPD